MLVTLFVLLFIYLFISLAEKWSLNDTLAKNCVDRNNCERAISKFKNSQLEFDHEKLKQSWRKLTVQDDKEHG